MKTSELTGAALDWAVAKCEGYRLDLVPEDSYTPSTDWSQGGPIIEREGISIVQQGDAAEWVASVYNHHEDDWHLHTNGPTPLIAAMRCYVASKLGDDINIPEELL
jgi:hypothetical protein